MTCLKQLIEKQSSENEILQVKNSCLERENKNLAEAKNFHGSNNNPPKENEVALNNNEFLRSFDKYPNNRTGEFDSLIQFVQNFVNTFTLTEAANSSFNNQTSNEINIKSIVFKPVELFINDENSKMSDHNIKQG